MSPTVVENSSIVYPFQNPFDLSTMTNRRHSLIPRQRQRHRHRLESLLILILIRSKLIINCNKQMKDIRDYLQS